MYMYVYILTTNNTTSDQERRKNTLWLAGKLYTCSYIYTHIYHYKCTNAYIIH